MLLVLFLTDFALLDLKFVGLLRAVVDKYDVKKDFARLGQLSFSMRGDNFKTCQYIQSYFCYASHYLQPLFELGQGIYNLFWDSNEAFEEIFEIEH